MARGNKFWEMVWRKTTELTIFPYHAHPQPEYFVMEFCRNFLKARQQYSVAEIGCGPFAHFSRLIKKGFRGSFFSNIRLVAIDVIKDFMKTGMETVTFITASAEEFPPNIGEFDLMIYPFVFEYLDKEKAISELKRVLKDEGVAIFLLNNKKSPFLWSEKEIQVWEKQDAEFAEQLKRVNEIQERNAFESADAAGRFFSEHGFEVIQLNEFKIAGTNVIYGYGIIVRKKS